MRTVFLVPRRSGEFYRDRSWEWVQRRWRAEHPDWPIIEGHHTRGLFNRSAAINAAAAAAGEWDVAVIADSDSFVDADRLREAVALAATSGRMVVAFTRRAHVRQAMSEQILAGYPGPWEPGVADYLEDGSHHSGMNAVPRHLWELTGGFDEGFTAPGAEDTAFNLMANDAAGYDPSIEVPALCGLPGGHYHVPGVLWHLWHPIRDDATPENLARLERYYEVHAAGGHLSEYLRLRLEVSV